MFIVSTDETQNNNERLTKNIDHRGDNESVRAHDN